jgi:hypothetical protein
VIDVDRPELEALAAKYREMIALRADVRVKDETRLKALAARFPGALRELDTRTMESLETRIREVEAAMAGAAAPSWASVQIRFHGWLRVALRMRVDGVVDVASARGWVTTYAPSDAGDPPREALDDAALTTLLAPPDGRVSLAARAMLGVDDAALDALLFGTR